MILERISFTKRKLIEIIYTVRQETAGRHHQTAMLTVGVMEMETVEIMAEETVTVEEMELEEIQEVARLEQVVMERM